MKDINELDNVVVLMGGHSYEINKLEEPINLTDQNEGIETEGTHILTGFEEDLLLVTEDHGDEGCFYFAHMVGDTGLIVNIEDDSMHEKAAMILVSVVNACE